MAGQQTRTRRNGSGLALVWREPSVRLQVCRCVCVGGWVGTDLWRPRAAPALLVAVETSANNPRSLAESRPTDPDTHLQGSQKVRPVVYLVKPRPGLCIIPSLRQFLHLQACLCCASLRIRPWARLPSSQFLSLRCIVAVAVLRLVTVPQRQSSPRQLSVPVGVKVL